MIERVRIRVDGKLLPDEGLAQLAMVNYGHFTAMQIRSRRVRGLAKHIKRLQHAHTELFGTVVDPAAILESIQQAASDAADSYLRVTLFETEPGEVRIMTVLRDPVDAPAAPVSLYPVAYQRPVAHIKHVGSFGQLYYGRQAREQGFDDALLMTPEGEISETSIANIAFIDADGGVVWPSAPSLQGITWQILDEALIATGINVRKRSVVLEEVSQFAGAFVANSLGIAPVHRIGTTVSFDVAVAGEFITLYDAIPLDPISPAL